MNQAHQMIMRNQGAFDDEDEDFMDMLSKQGAPPQHYNPGAFQGGLHIHEDHMTFEESKGIIHNDAMLPNYMQRMPSSGSNGSGGGGAEVNANLLNMSGFQSEVIQKQNIYSEITVSGPKWSKDGG